MSHHIPEVVIWCLAIALTAVAVLLVRQRTITNGVRRRVAQLEESLRARDEETAHLVGVRLPAVVDAVGQDTPPPGPLDARLAGTAFAHDLQAVIELFARAVDKAQARADQSAKAALKASMRALQGLAHEQQLAISEMQERHDHPDVLRDLLEIDHANAQFGRRAQAIAVLCGSWPGRQRVASPLTDVVRGATSRIRDYRRVRVHGPADGDLAVVSRAVEPVVLAVAELLDNAARHSQPNTTVEVGIQPVHNGACVIIDDAGVGMDGREVEEAVAMLAGRRPVDVSRLGDPPQFGFPVIGVLAARYGFSVSVDTRSPYGGVRAVVFLPATLLTQLDVDGPSTTPLRPRTPETTPPPPDLPPLADPPRLIPHAPGGATPPTGGEPWPEDAATDAPAPGRPAHRAPAGADAWQDGAAAGTAPSAADSRSFRADDVDTRLDRGRPPVDDAQAPGSGATPPAGAGGRPDRAAADGPPADAGTPKAPAGGYAWPDAAADVPPGGDGRNYSSADVPQAPGAGALPPADVAREDGSRGFPPGGARRARGAGPVPPAGGEAWQGGAAADGRGFPPAGAPQARGAGGPSGAVPPSGDGGVPHAGADAPGADGVPHAGHGRGFPPAGAGARREAPQPHAGAPGRGDVPPAEAGAAPFGGGPHGFASADDWPERPAAGRPAAPRAGGEPSGAAAGGRTVPPADAGGAPSWRPAEGHPSGPGTVPTADTADTAAPRPRTVPTADTAAGLSGQSGQSGEPVAPWETTAGGLPKRRRREPAVGRRGAGAPAAPAAERTAEETARRMGAFARGTRAGRTDGRGHRYQHPEDEGNPYA